MKINELKQPYRRMAEYLAEKYCSGRTNLDLMTGFDWDNTGLFFWDAVNKGEPPEITEKIKAFFPDDFDFSGDEVKKRVGLSYNGSDLAVEFNTAYNRLHEYTRDEFFIGKKRVEKKEEYYTQLEKEGKFDELPDTCEFSEPIEMEVWNREDCKVIVSISGKFKGLYLGENKFPRNNIFTYKFAQIHTPKIDFSQFKKGDVVEFDCAIEDFKGTVIGYVYSSDRTSINITPVKGQIGRHILEKQIKTINKIK